MLLWVDIVVPILTNVKTLEKLMLLDLKPQKSYSTSAHVIDKSWSYSMNDQNIFENL